MPPKIKIETIAPPAEQKPEIREIFENNSRVIIELLENKGSKLGEGNTANVHSLNSKGEFCIKIIKKPEYIPAGVSYNYPAKEMRFLVELQGINSSVRVPIPYLIVDYGGTKCLVMETLHAFSVRDILEGKGSLPKGFKIKEFYDQLMDFVEKMHDMKIYHRDLHEGNVMINPDTGEIYVIDFGGSAQAFSEEEAHLDGSIRSTRDGDNVARIFRDLKKYILTGGKK